MLNWGSHSGDFEESVVLCCNAMQRRKPSVTEQHRLCLQARRVSELLLSVCFLLFSCFTLFNPEYGGGMFLCNVGPSRRYNHEELTVQGWTRTILLVPHFVNCRRMCWNVPELSMSRIAWTHVATRKLRSAGLRRGQARLRVNITATFWVHFTSLDVPCGVFHLCANSRLWG